MTLQEFATRFSTGTDFDQIELLDNFFDEVEYYNVEFPVPSI
jgi:hypothetical protein